MATGQMTPTNPEDGLKKRKLEHQPASTSATQIVSRAPQPQDQSNDDGARKQAELLFREHTRLTMDINPLYTHKLGKQAELLSREHTRLTVLDINPLYIHKLKTSGELGYRHPVTSKKLEVIYLEIDVPEFRRCISDVLTKVLTIRYYGHGHLRDSEIAAELAEIVPLTVNACLCALYAKLRNIHRAYGKQATRYPTPPHYTKEVELPLPLAMAIQDFGSFQTSSLETNYILVPTYPEGTGHEGRADADFNITDYQSYIPTFKDLGIPCKTVDPFVKKGTAWWTYQVNNSHGTTDLVCILPPSLYTPLSAEVRSLFLATKPNSDECSDIISFTRYNTVNFGVRFREIPPNTNVRTFLALAHGPIEEWSNGAPDV